MIFGKVSELMSILTLAEKLLISENHEVLREIRFTLKSRVPGVRGGIRVIQGVQLHHRLFGILY